MIIQFRFKNFKSFRDDAILDFTAIPEIKEFQPRVISAWGEELLPVAAIWGANASGKSNVIEAVRYMQRYVVLSLLYAGDISENQNVLNVLPYNPFLFDETSKTAESLFEIYLRVQRRKGVFIITVSRSTERESFKNG